MIKSKQRATDSGEVNAMLDVAAKLGIEIYRDAFEAPPP